ncbi:class I SAM-dependent methyltransferase [Bradyrhizobium prioriisuperbiae]|uniref:class I SAM-dependent methyltransferase n=1 Tax=Bradyrhizobium prioriisuperbiae TaxID=2854389 RepID=UPI0028F01811|nr:class I SAM-dependent methyltransferase [Bradyrhizobium prioritasuperba]
MSEEGNLLSIFEAHRGKLSDKWSSYLSLYDHAFRPYRDRKISLLEIGIQNGGSLEIYAKYFANFEHIVGCDIEQRCALLRYGERIDVVTGDCNEASTKRAIACICAEFDIIIDDGSHVSGDIIRAFLNYFPLLKPGGIFVVEDLHCSYWQNWGGGLYRDVSSISFLKMLVDVVNHEHWGNGEKRREPIDRRFPGILPNDAEALLSEIHSVQFHNSICIISKALPPQNALGLRLVAGTEALIDEGPRLSGGASSDESDQSANPQAFFRDIKAENEVLHKMIVERDAQLVSLNNLLVDRNSETQTLNNSLAEQRMVCRALHVALAAAPPIRVHWLERLLWRTTLGRRLCRILFIRGQAQLLEDYRLVLGSGQFDLLHYIKYNQDALHEIPDPILHYLMVGYREGRDPSPLFSSRKYISEHGMVGDINPLVHHIRSTMK